MYIVSSFQMYFKLTLLFTIYVPSVYAFMCLGFLSYNRTAKNKCIPNNSPKVQAKNDSNK